MKGGHERRPNGGRTAKKPADHCCGSESPTACHCASCRTGPSESSRRYRAVRAQRAPAASGLNPKPSHDLWRENKRKTYRSKPQNCNYEQKNTDLAHCLCISFSPVGPGGCDPARTRKFFRTNSRYHGRSGWTRRINNFFCKRRLLLTRPNNYSRRTMIDHRATGQ
jgi:hypothetical protein